MSISLLPINKFANIPPLNEKYTTPESRAKTVVVLGSSKYSDAIAEHIELCSNVTKGLINNGYNILSGCGAHGIMGATYKAAEENSLKDLEGKPMQNLAIVVEPPWGDEDIEHCIPVGKASSEEDRILKFRQTADNFVIFPGGDTTLEEATTLIRLNKHNPDNTPQRKIVFVGEKFFSGLIEQYRTLFNSGLAKLSTENLFKVFNSETEILKEFPKLNRLI